MFSRGEFTIDNVTYGAIVSHTKVCTEVLLVLSGQVVSAYKTDVTGSYSYNNSRAKELSTFILNGAKGCTAKNGSPAPFELGAVTIHEFIKAKVEYVIQLYRGEIVAASIQSDRVRIELEYCKEHLIPQGIPYVKLTTVKKNIELSEDDLDSIPVRSVEEIALEKESVEWLANKKYYIVNDDAIAEQLFQYLENFDKAIAYDTESTGLRINCFGKIGSSYMKSLIKYNEEHPDEQIRADRLVGIIFCVEPDVSYYFPCFNRKFKNLYEDKESPIRKKIIQDIKTRYTMSNPSMLDSDMASYILNTPDDEWPLAVILMERVRNILEKKHIVAHNGTFEWKIGHQYGIDTNIKDDTMIMHKIMYKFRSTTSNRGEPSDLKYLAKRELGIDQWELKDFFPNLKEDKAGTVRTKKGAKKSNNGVKIDFSYMTYEGTRIYAPADGDVTLQLFYKYKKDLLANHSEMIYVYEVEVIVSMAIAYMEFYGHRLDESKIEDAKNQTIINLALIESEIRQAVSYADEKEISAYKALKELRSTVQSLAKATNENDIAKRKELEAELMPTCDALKQAISENTKNVINLSAPGQVADLFYDRLKYPLQGDKKSVAKNVIKALIKEKDEEGNPKYPVANMYSKYKNEETLLQKFFDNLPYFMYPGGFIFSSYGQIAAATGRMSCIDGDAYISTKYGLRKLSDIRKGDQVYCYDGLGNLHIRKVLNTIDQGEKDCIQLKLTNNRVCVELKCTPDHRIRKPNGEWIQACQLNYGDKVSGMRSLGEADIYEVYDIKFIRERHVYDIEVEEFNNFIANEICVHNCSKPNAQQYPKVITKIVYPRDGHVMLDADYSQIEYRVLTAMAHNDDLAVMFSDPDSDYHTLMASLMYDTPYASVTPKMRSSAKSFNFGIPYGMGFGSLAILLHGNKKQSSIEDAKEKYELYFKNQPRTRQFFDDVKEMALINGWTRTLFNRYRYYSFVDKDGNVNNARKAAALRQAGNAVIQGCLSGETLIHTKDMGIVRIQDAVGYSGKVWNGKKWTYGDVLYSGKKQKCIIKFTNGQKFVCSPEHRFKVYSECDVTNPDFYKDHFFVKCKYLKVGNAIEINLDPSKLCIQYFDQRFNKVTCAEAGDYCSDEFVEPDFERLYYYTEELECVVVESVEITDEYIDMYDVCNTEEGYYVADGIITHNTAADIFKIGVARNFNYIRENRLFGELLIVNMIHDEQLMEINTEKVNVQRVVTDVCKNMQFKIEGFPPLFVGAGLGPAWGVAKGKMAEIHPTLLDELTKESDSIPIFKRDQDPNLEPKEILAYFDERIHEFRRKKVYDYLANPDNWYKDIHPAIGSLINLQFNYGRGDEASAYTGPNGEKYTDQEFLELNIADFLKENNIEAEASYFKFNDTIAEQKKDEAEKESDGYDDNEDSEEELDDIMIEAEDTFGIFSEIKEDSSLFGSSIQDIIGIFGCCILVKQKLCGIDIRGYNYRQVESLINMLASYACEPDDPEAKRVVFLKESNILKYSEVYIKGIQSSELERQYKEIRNQSKSKSLT